MSVGFPLISSVAVDDAGAFVSSFWLHHPRVLLFQPWPGPTIFCSFSLPLGGPAEGLPSGTVPGSPHGGAGRRQEVSTSGAAPRSPQKAFLPQNVDREKGLYPPVMSGSWVMLALSFLVGIWAAPPAHRRDPSAVTTKYLHTTRQARAFNRLWEHLQDCLLLQVCR